MMNRVRRPIIAALLSLLLVISQQAAIVHLLSHVHGKINAATQVQVDHGAIDGGADTCITCIAFAGVGSNGPPAFHKLPLAFSPVDRFDRQEDGPSYARPAFVPQARAPPVFL